MKPVTDYEVVDHGFDAEQYFQGCGTAFTDFEDVATGIGDTAQEAFEDALDSLAQNDWDVSKIKGKSKLTRQTVRGYLRDIGIRFDPDGDGAETHYYVSIRVK
ncbi:MAG: hypothetical protein BWY66_00370 [bacterium ADurb.Bin374]|nr:MAG: hypothetical protein BWY66_00370 [bacterium ADurb.Bin374]